MCAVSAQEALQRSWELVGGTKENIILPNWLAIEAIPSCFLQKANSIELCQWLQTLRNCSTMSGTVDRRRQHTPPDFSRDGPLVEIPSQTQGASISITWKSFVLSANGYEASFLGIVKYHGFCNFFYWTRNYGPSGLLLVPASRGNTP